MTRLEIDHRFTYHPPIGNQTARYEALRNTARYPAHRINDLCPESREKSLALTHLEEAVMQANAAIARNENATTSTVPVTPECLVSGAETAPGEAAAPCPAP
jgi:hypothetical protein